MRRLLTVLFVCALGFILGAALHDATRTAESAAASATATAATAAPSSSLPAAAIEALRADLAALEVRVTEEVAGLSAAPPDAAATIEERLPEQLASTPDPTVAAAMTALQADLAALEQRLAERIDRVAAAQAATTDALDGRLDALESGLASSPIQPAPLPPAPLPPAPLPNAPLPRP